MLNSKNLAKHIQYILIALVFCLVSAASSAAPGKQLLIPVGVGDITIFVPLLTAPSAVAIVEETQSVGESLHQVSWHAVNNAAYYQFDITDESGVTTSVTTTSLNYALSNLPLGTSHVELLACNDRNQCGAATSLGAFTITERVRYAVADLLGSPILETDQAGNVISEFHYKPFGETKEEKHEDIGYTGHLEDIDLGLTYMQARYYDPVLGRFYSNDPVGFTGHLVDSQGPQGFNRYAYVNNNPYKYRDPDGKVAFLAFFVPLLSGTGGAAATTTAVTATAVTFTATEVAVAVVAGTTIAVTATVLMNESGESADSGGKKEDNSDKGGEDAESTGDQNESSSPEYKGHGENPQGKTGKGKNWNKHSGKRSGTKYGEGRNEARGSKNKKFEKPKNPNKRPEQE